MNRRSNTCSEKRKDSSKGRSPAFQESTNLPDGSSGKKEETNVGLKASTPIPSETGKLATDEDKFAPTPLSGKPFFSCILLKSHVQAPYQLTIPNVFWSLLPAANVPVILSYRNKNWEMRYIGDRSIRRFDGGWRHFAVDNKLMIGDGCVFELMDGEHLRFDVWILSGQVPKLFAYSGRSSEAPIMVDD